MPSGLATIGTTECLGACQGAPVVLLNDAHYHEDVTPDSLNTLLAQLVEKADE